jgi:hypothetical protein
MREIKWNHDPWSTLAIRKTSTLVCLLFNITTYFIYLLSFVHLTHYECLKTPRWVVGYKTIVCYCGLFEEDKEENHLFPLRVWYTPPSKPYGGKLCLLHYSMLGVPTSGKSRSRIVAITHWRGSGGRSGVGQQHVKKLRRRQVSCRMMPLSLLHLICLSVECAWLGFNNTHVHTPHLCGCPASRGYWSTRMRLKFGLLETATCYSSKSVTV